MIRLRSLAGLLLVGCNSVLGIDPPIPPDASSVACGPTEAFCGARCIDVWTDPENCGGCASDCTGGTCANGRCKLTTDPLVVEEGSAHCIDVGPDAIYVGSLGYLTGPIVTLPTKGGSIAPIVKGESQPHDVQWRDPYLYWESSTSIRRLKLGDANATIEIVVPLVDGATLAVDSSSIFWSTQADAIWRAGLDGSNPTLIRNPSADYTGLFLALGGDNVFFLAPLEYSVGYLPKAGGNETILATGSYSLSFATDGSSVFWALTGSIESTSLSNVGHVTTVVNAQDNPASLVVDGEHLYWMNLGTSTNDGAIVRAKTDGSERTELAHNLNRPRCLAVDGTSIYWVTDDGTFWKRGK